MEFNFATCFPGTQLYRVIWGYNKPWNKDLETWTNQYFMVHVSLVGFGEPLVTWSLGGLKQFVMAGQPTPP